MGVALLLPRLRPDQWAIVEHPAKVKLMNCGRRWGKTVLSGCVALSAAAQGAKVLWMAPTYRNSRPIWRWAEAATVPLVRRNLVRLNRSERTIEFPSSGGFLGVYSADNDTGVRGEWFNLAILDEAARIPDTTWTDVVQPALADADGDALLPSTPMGKNWFWSEWQRGYTQMDGEIAAWTAPSSANPSANIQRAAALAKDRVPDATYRQEWLAEFVEGSFDIYEAAWFTDTRFLLPNTLPPSRVLGRYLSWDTAFKDKDSAAYSACVVGELVLSERTGTYELRIVDVWRDRVTFPNLMDHMRRLYAKHNTDGKVLAQVIEDRASGISAYQTLVQAAPADDARSIVAFSPQGSKDQRASQAAIWCKAGLVTLPHPGAESRWLLAFEDELFQQGAWYDQRDAFAQLVLYLEGYLSEGLHAARAQEAAVLFADAAGAPAGTPTGPRSVAPQRPGFRSNGALVGANGARGRGGNY
ncbi:MAG TPA: hypothetical protein VNM48_04005 [Chloroflexota bacterium]|nr:hypothetical protein [Chloroflexota bacterium]